MTLIEVPSSDTCALYDANTSLFVNLNAVVKIVYNPIDPFGELTLTSGNVVKISPANTEFWNKVFAFFDTPMPS